MQLISESVTIAIVFYGWNKDARRLDAMTEILLGLIPERGAVVLPADELKAVNPQNAANMVKAATGNQAA